MVVPCDTVAVNHVAFKKEEKKEAPVVSAPAPVVAPVAAAPKVVKPSKKNK